jgi:hypothetical protein
MQWRLFAALRREICWSWTMEVTGALDTALLNMCTMYNMYNINPKHFIVSI